MFYTSCVRGFLKVDDVQLTGGKLVIEDRAKSQDGLARSITVAVVSVSWIAIAVVTAVMTVSAILQGAVGFGLGTIAIPFLIYLDLRFVPGPLLVAALTLHMLVLQRDRSGVDPSGLDHAVQRSRARYDSRGRSAASLPLDSMKMLLAGVVLAGAVMGSCIRAGIQRVGFFGAGAVSGFMATTAGLGGPPVALSISAGRACVCAARSPPTSSSGRCSRSPRSRGRAIRRRRTPTVRVFDSRDRARLLHVAAGGGISGQRSHQGRGPHCLSARSRQRHRDGADVD